MKETLEIVEQAKKVFQHDLRKLASNGGMTREVYIKYLSFQYHLTKGVQRHFLAAAANPGLSGRRGLRDFLYRFALEEEPHFDIARHDIEAMGETLVACPLDVALWWTFFDRIIDERPFMRLGATCVLENLGAGAGDLGHRLLDEADFLNDSNTRFLQIHFHEELPHGDQIIAALEAADPKADELADLATGAKIGATFYLRMARWALGQCDLMEQFDPSGSTISVVLSSEGVAV